MAPTPKIRPYENVGRIHAACDKRIAELEAERDEVKALLAQWVYLIRNEPERIHELLDSASVASTPTTTEERDGTVNDDLMTSCPIPTTIGNPCLSMTTVGLWLRS